MVIETAGSSGNTVLYLYNSSLTQISYNDDKGDGTLFSRISLASLPAGTYYITVMEYGNDGTIGAYTLRASWTDVSVNPLITVNDRPATFAVSSGTNRVRLQFDVPTTEDYVIQTAAGSLADTVIALWSPTGSHIAQDDDSGVMAAS